MGIKEDVLALAEELDGVSVKKNCEACLASGTELCRGDLECAESAHKACAKRLRAIAEHDADDVTTVIAYDLLPDEDREAIAWVREQGGIDLVKAFVHQGAVEHGYLLKIAHTLGTSIYDGTDNADALLEKLSERLMPEGMEWLIGSWPRFDDNEPARWNDEYANGNGGVSPLRHVSLYADGRAMLGKGKTKVVLAPGERVKRPAPKVLDADGEEVRVGDVLYGVETGGSVTVDSIESGNPWFATTDGALQHCAKFTHRAPILAADGKPLREGETVYKLEDSRPYTVKRIDGDHVYINAGGKAVDIWTFPGKLTHEQPDTWERLEHDAEKTVCEYFGANYDCANCPLESARCAEEVKKDIIRRAKKMAERGA